MVSLGQKLKFTKTCEKRFFNHIRVVLCKKPLEKTPNIGKMRRFSKSAIVQRLQTWKNSQFASKIKMIKNIRKTFLQARQSCSVQKTAGKNTKYSRNETILKIGHLPKAIDFAKCSVWAEIKMTKNIGKPILQAHQSCSVKKTARINTQYSRNETVLKIHHLPNPKDFEKCSLSVKN